MAGISAIGGYGSYDGYANFANYRVFGIGQKDESAEKSRAVDPDEEKKAGYKSSPEECETCKRRKYKDGSDEMVSFKSPQHVSPEAAAAAVRAHEGEHVSNAYKKAAQKNGKVVNASVRINTSICPECGRSYVSGGVTHTQIKYYNEDNPYQKALKKQDETKYKGMNINYAA